MNILKLSAITYFALKAKKIPNVNAIYSYDSSQFYNFSVSNSGSILGIFDYQRSNYLSGNFKGNGWSVYDYFDSKFLDYTENNNGYRIYDYDTSSFYELNINNQSVSIYSYKDQKYYNFGY